MPLLIVSVSFEIESVWLPPPPVFKNLTILPFLNPTPVSTPLPNVAKFLRITTPSVINVSVT